MELAAVRALLARTWAMFKLDPAPAPGLDPRTATAGMRKRGQVAWFLVRENGTTYAVIKLVQIKSSRRMT